MKVQLVIVCSNRNCRHDHYHPEVKEGIRICDSLDILENVECKIDEKNNMVVNY